MFFNKFSKMTFSAFALVFLFFSTSEILPQANNNEDLPLPHFFPPGVKKEIKNPAKQ